MPHSQRFDREKAEDIHVELMYQLAKKFTNTYIIDFRKFAPVYDNNFKAKYYLNSHLNVYGYIFTSQMMLSYIDYIIKENADDFILVPLMNKKTRYLFDISEIYYRSKVHSENAEEVLNANFLIFHDKKFCK